MMIAPMVRNSIAAMTLALGLSAYSAALAVSRSDSKTCQSSEANPYVGNYKWRGSRGVQQVRFWFERTEPAGDAKLKAEGRGIYLGPPPVNITIRATIELKTNRIEIWESKPDSDAFLTNGSHVGAISADRCSIQAVWTTKGSGKQGDLNLRIERK